MADNGFEIAAPWRRLVAAIVDGMLIFIPVAMVRWITGQASLGTILALGYFVYFTGAFGQTFGKMLTGIRVVRTDGSAPDFATAALREVVGKFISGLVFGIGYLWALWDGRSQGWHDKIGGTLVVRSDAKQTPGLPERHEPWVVSGLDVRDTIRSSIDRAIKTGADAIAASVQRDRPNLQSHAAPDGTVTIMFCDLTGAAELTDRLGDVRSRELLGVYRNLVREAVGAQEGREVKSSPDSFMVAFRSARRALLCAADIQRRLAERTAAHPDEPLLAGIGLHTGEVVHDSGDVYGRNVVLASRIADCAGGGQVLASSVIRELTDGSGEFRFDEGRDVSLKDLSGTYRIYELERSQV